MAGMAVMGAVEMDRAQHARPAAAIGKFPSRELGPPHERLLYGRRLCPAAVGVSAGNTTSTRTKLALSFFFADLTDQSTTAPIAGPPAKRQFRAMWLSVSPRPPALRPFAIDAHTR